MRPRIRAGVYHAAVPGGVCWLTAGGPVTLSGRSVAAVTERLVPLLDGRRTPAELTAALSEEHRAMVTRLVRTLVARGVAEDADAPAAERRLTGRAVVIAPEEAVADCVRALLRAGADDVVTGRPGELPAGVSCAVQIFGRDEVAQARQTAELAARQEIPLVQALVSRGQALIGPPAADVCWEAIWWRLRDKDAFRAPGPLPAGAAPRVLAARLALLLAGDGGAGDGRVCWFDAGSLASSWHHVLPGTREGEVASSPREAFARTGRRARRPRAGGDAEPDRRVWSEDDFSRRVARAIDPRFGPISELGEGDLDQVPLRRSRAVVAAPPYRRAVTVGAYGADFATARRRTALRALAAYGALALDPRRLTPAGEHEGWVRGLRLADGAPCRVAAGAVYPVLRPDREPVPLGAAAGLSWEQTVSAGLQAHHRQAVLDARDEVRGVRVPREVVAADPVAAGYLRVLTAAGHDAGVVDVSGLAGAPAAAVLLDGVPVEVVCRPGIGAAVRDAVEAAVHAAQTGLTTPVLAGVLNVRTEPWNPPPDLRPTGLPGRVPVFVPYDHDPGLAEVVAWAGAVVMLDA